MHHTKIILIIFIILSAILTLIIFAFFISNIKKLQQHVGFVESHNQLLLTELADYKEQTKKLKQITVSAENSDSPTIAIGEIMTRFTQQQKGHLSLYYKNLTTNEKVVIDGDRKYYMASFYKVLLTLYILDQIENQTLSLSDKVPGGDLTMEQALNKIITESNNEYARALAEKFGWAKMEKSLKQKLGIEFSFDNNLSMDVNNMGKLFEEISLSLKISDDESNYLLQLLNDQKKLNKLPKYLPKNIYSHNKTGEFESFSHDAGIFYTPKANYILIFMSETPTPANTNEKMAKMSKELFDVLNVD